ncbi:MAG TPA: hypothetical protein VFI78_05490 [Salinimicrobium sp.]|nr:hypothetical protein [Salinimicrobium sp.]
MKKSRNPLLFLCLLFLGTLMLHAYNKDEKGILEPEQPQLNEYGATATIKLENGATFPFETSIDEKGVVMARAYLIKGNEGVVISLVDAKRENVIMLTVGGSLSKGTYSFTMHGAHACGALLALDSTDFFPVKKPSDRTAKIYGSSIINGAGPLSGGGTIKITSFTETNIQAIFHMILFNRAGEKVTVSNGKVNCKVGKFNE